MNIQIYVTKKNPAVLKAERFFKERRVPYQLVDLHKHRLGARELALFAKAAGDAAAPAFVLRPGSPEGGVSSPSMPNRILTRGI